MFIKKHSDLEFQQYKNHNYFYTNLKYPINLSIYLPITINNSLIPNKILIYNEQAKLCVEYMSEWMSK